MSLEPKGEGILKLDVSPVPAAETERLRELYRREMNCQIVHDSWHGRGWTDSYLLRVDGRVVGYGLVGGIRAESKEIVTEFYVLPDHRSASLPLFRQFVATSGASSIEVQSNDVQSTLLLYDCATDIRSDVILFHDSTTTRLAPPGTLFRESVEADREGLGRAHLDSDARWVVEAQGEAVAAGGVLFHYNIPFGDIYMAVAEPHQRNGYGGYLVQELKRVCYESGRVPSARCNTSNAASRATLQKAGFLPCARVLTGTLRL